MARDMVNNAIFDSLSKIADKQVAYILLRDTIMSTCTHLSRTLPPKSSLAALTAFDNSVVTMLAHLVQVEPAKLDKDARLRAGLPLSMAGLALRNLAENRYLDYFASCAHTLRIAHTFFKNGHAVLEKWCKDRTCSVGQQLSRSLEAANLVVHDGISLQGRDNALAQEADKARVTRLYKQAVTLLNKQARTPGAVVGDAPAVAKPKKLSQHQRGTSNAAEEKPQEQRVPAETQQPQPDSATNPMDIANDPEVSSGGSSNSVGSPPQCQLRGESQSRNCARNQDHSPQVFQGSLGLCITSKVAAEALTSRLQVPFGETPQELQRAGSLDKACSAPEYPSARCLWISQGHPIYSRPADQARGLHHNPPPLAADPGSTTSGSRTAQGLQVPVLRDPPTPSSSPRISSPPLPPE